MNHVKTKVPLEVSPQGKYSIKAMAAENLDTSCLDAANLQLGQVEGMKVNGKTVETRLQDAVRVVPRAHSHRFKMIQAIISRFFSKKLILEAGHKAGKSSIGFSIHADIFARASQHPSPL